MEAVNSKEIMYILNQHKSKMKLMLKVCVRCSFCAESCFLYRCREKNPKYMPSMKIINSLGKLYKKRGKVSRKELEDMREILWHDCVLCTRCNCPMGINIPEMIALARRVLRSQGIYYSYGMPVDKMNDLSRERSL